MFNLWQNTFGDFSSSTLHFFATFFSFFLSLFSLLKFYILLSFSFHNWIKPFLLFAATTHLIRLWITIYFERFLMFHKQLIVASRQPRVKHIISQRISFDNCLVSMAFGSRQLLSVSREKKEQQIEWNCSLSFSFNVYHFFAVEKSFVKYFSQNSSCLTLFNAYFLRFLSCYIVQFVTRITTRFCYKCCLLLLFDWACYCLVENNCCLFWWFVPVWIFIKWKIIQSLQAICACRLKTIKY